MAPATYFSKPLEIRGSRKVSEDVSPERCKAFLDLGITLAIFLWPSLTLAVNSGWGGPESSSKREWFASATIELITENPDAEEDWIEEFLLNVMFDEFEVNVEDNSALDTAETIVRLRKDCAQGDWAEVLSMNAKWNAKNQGKDIGAPEFMRGEDIDAETSGSDDEYDDYDDYDDRDSESVMPKPAREKKPLEIDEEGFTKVTNRKK